LEEAGAEQEVHVEVKKGAFPRRSYDTFSLPAGVYESLRITLGEGEGENWWCVVFPSLCLPAAGRSFGDTAAGAGFPDSLTGALEGRCGYEVRFFVLDCLCYLENLFFKG
jgi:stage II sporulation protein R